MSEAATETSWLGETSMRVTSSGLTMDTSPSCGEDTKSSSSEALLVVPMALAWAMTWPSS